jgi:hypothetical protein
MTNQNFYEQIFPEFWQKINSSNLVEDSHSMFGDEEIFAWLINTIEPRELIEIGSWKGHSANYMIDACKARGLASRIVCVDTFLGGPEHWLLPGSIETLHRKNGQPTIFDRFLANTIARGNANHVFPLCLDSAAASKVLKHFNFAADLIFVDGGHDYQDAVSDISKYYPLLSETGVMFGDDYQAETVANAVHDCARKLGVEVLVSARKWILLNEALVRRLTLPGTQLRKSFEGWIHP